MKAIDNGKNQTRSKMNQSNRINITVSPKGSLELLSHKELERLRDSSEGGIHELLRRCSIAVLNCGAETDNTKEILEEFHDFDIHLIKKDWGLQLQLINAPASAFVNKKMLKGIQEHLFAIFRDIVYVSDYILKTHQSGMNSGSEISDIIFNILRNANVLISKDFSNIVVCWGGHAISRNEYQYTKDVGYQMGLYGLDICTGCGPGAMKGPMKGALIGHYKQRIHNGRYLGFTEPGIIAAEPPNPIVNGLVTLPDIEKRLEAFVRTSHAIIVFPGGPGSIEEILYILGILLHPENKGINFPLFFTGPEACKDYFQMVHDFIGATLGFQAQQLYKIIIDDPKQVTGDVKLKIDEIMQSRKSQGDSFFFNWHLKISQEFQEPFEPTHDNMAGLQIHKDMETQHLAANLRRAFSGIVAGNVKDEGIRAVEKHGPYKLNGDADIMEKLDALLSNLVEQQRMKLPGSDYVPCYKIV
jgi:pyrimidine/purine-5'-nucleotide nucleosidase